MVAISDTFTLAADTDYTVAAIGDVTNQPLDRRIEGRRAGDPDSLVSDPSRIRATVPWQPQYDDLETIITHALQWERRLSELRDRG